MIFLNATDKIQAVAGTATAITSTMTGDEVDISGSTPVDSPKKFDQRQLPITTPDLLYTPGTSKYALIKSWVLKNTTASAVTVILYLGGTTGSPTAANQIDAFSIPANGKAKERDGAFDVFDANGAFLTTISVTSTIVDGSTLEVVAGVIRVKDSGVTNAKLADMVQTTFKGRKAGAGTGAPQDMTASEAKTALAIANTDVSGLGTASTKNTGNSVNDPGTGALEILFPVQAQITGTSKVWATTDLDKYQSRANSGVAMTDTMPTGISAVNGMHLIIANDDPSASITLTAGGSQTFVNSSGAAGATTFVLKAGRRTQFVYYHTGGFWRLLTNNNNLTKGKSGSTFTLGNLVKSSTNTDGSEIDDAGVAVSTDVTLASNSDAKIPTEKAVKTYADQLIASADAMVFKGVIDASANPNYPAADRGWTYRISVAGKIGGASGINVEVGDLILCLTDGTASGTQAAVGANWSISQANIDGAVTGPTSSTSGNIPTFNGVSGKVIQDGGVAVSIDGTMASNSDAKLPTEKAVVTYAQPKDATLTALAAQDWVANNIPIGSGANTVAQIPFAANTFPGRTSTGNLVAKTLDDAGAAFLAASGAAGQTALLNSATTSLKGLMPATHFVQTAGEISTGIIYAVNNPYSNVACDGSTDDTTACTNLFANAPDGSTIVWPGLNSTMVLSGAVPIPSGKHFVLVGGGPGNKTNILQTSLTANHFTCNDWYTTFTGFNFTTNFAQCTTNGQALTSGTVVTISNINTALVPATGTINIGSTAGWQTLTYSARTSTSVTLSQTGTGTTMVFPGSAATGPVVFKIAGAAINAGNLVGIDCVSNTFSYCYNGYICAGTTSNQSRITGNGFLNTINFDIWIDAANWNGIIDSNTMDCTIASRSVSHCEITQCGSLTGQGNQFIRGQSNLRLGSTTAAYPAGVFGVYFSNCFFDNAGGDAIKFQGISAIQRIKVTSSWISSAATNGVNFASTASTLPSDIEFVGCNVYANTTAGFAGSGVQDYKVIGGQVAGNGTGFLITANAGGTYSAFAEGVRIGPTGGFGANTTGINIATGTYTGVVFDHCDTRGNTTNLTLGTVTITGAFYERFSLTGNAGINPRGSVGTVAVPGSGVAQVNNTGFPATIIQRFTVVPTGLSINGVATVLPIATSVLSHHLLPGGSITTTGGTYTWTWVGQ